LGTSPSVVSRDVSKPRAITQTLCAFLFNFAPVREKSFLAQAQRKKTKGAKSYRRIKTRLDD
jgi:hypothetical protein